jgi:hypothetical protein
MIERKTEYIINKLTGGESAIVIIDRDYKEFIEKRPYVLSIICTTYDHAMQIHVKLDPRYDKQEAINELEEDIKSEIANRANHRKIQDEYQISYNFLQLNPVLKMPTSDEEVY